MVLKGENLTPWWCTNGANWFREQEMEKWWRKCTASHLEGKCGRAGKTAQLTLMEKDAKRWIQDRRNSGRDRHTFPQARVSQLTDTLLRTKRNAWGSCDSKGRERRQKDPGRDHQESFTEVLFGNKKECLLILCGKRPKLFQVCFSFWI